MAADPGSTPRSIASRAEAEQIAREYLRAKGRFLSNLTFTVRTVAEVGGPPALYGFDDAERRLTNSWLVYVTGAHPMTLESSLLVVISRTDGAVLYAGSANDEG